jgi:two-component system chemotaxis response regulator CheB
MLSEEESSPSMTARRAPETFARTENEHGHLTELGCPDCPGVLRVREEGKGGYLRLTCRVGHTFSSESFLEAKENAVEAALWSAIDHLLEVVSVEEELERRAKKSGRSPVAGEHAARAARGRALAASLQRVLERDEPAADPSAG